MKYSNKQNNKEISPKNNSEKRPEVFHDPEDDRWMVDNLNRNVLADEAERERERQQTKK